MSPLIEIFTRTPRVEKEIELEVPLISSKYPTAYGEISLKYKHFDHRKSVSVEVKGLKDIPTTNVNVSYRKGTSKANIARINKQMKVTLSEREINYLRQI